jgi:DNA polymerase-3 subunit delta
MSIVTSSFDLIKAFKKKDFAPIYLFHGDEDYFIDELENALEKNALEESEKAFNQSVVYGRDVSIGALRDMASRLPMMAPRQVIIVREAQDLKELITLQSYVEKPVTSTVICLCYKHKKVDGRTNFFKALKDKGVIFESKKLYDNQVEDWIRAYVKDLGFDISPEATSMAYEYIGNQISTITNELQKVVLNLPKGSKIEVDAIQNAIGVSREYNVFELQKALGQRQKERAFLILHQMNLDIKTNPAVLIIGSLATYFTKIFTLHSLHGATENEVLAAMGLKSSFFLKEYRLAAKYYLPHHLEFVFGLLHDYDLRAKGVTNRDTEEGELLRELVHGILSS